LDNEITNSALSITKDTAPTLNMAPVDISPALAHLSLTGIYAARGDKPFPLTKRLRLFSAIAFGRI
jgi:hypothetical protein